LGRPVSWSPWWLRLWSYSRHERGSSFHYPTQPNPRFCLSHPFITFDFHIQFAVTPDFIYLIDMIENVQRNFTKRISSIASLSYPERLAILDLDLLELRRLRFDLIYYFKYSTISHLLTPPKFSPSTHQQRAPDQNCLTCKNQSMPQNVSCQLSSSWSRSQPYRSRNFNLKNRLIQSSQLKGQRFQRKSKD
jgi:hypothetical protein